MLDKFQKLINTLKTLMWGVVAPIAGLIVLFLLNRNKDKYTATESKLETQVTKDEVKEGEQENEANVSEDNYNKLRDKYLKQFDDGGSDTESSGPKGAA